MSREEIATPTLRRIAEESALQSRNQYIDGLRGLAIGLVMLLHFSLAYGFKWPLPALVPSSWLRAVLVSGNYGVSMFFVISGFLITRNVQLRYGQLARVELKSFYLLRLFRLGPLLLVMLTVITALWFAGVAKFNNIQHGQPMPGWFQWLALFSVLSFWHNLLIEIVGNWFNYAMNICWSLSVEEVFYLAFPLLLRYLRARWTLLAVALILIVAGPVYRSLHRDDENYFLYGYLACFDQIVIGCVAAWLAPRIPPLASTLRKLLAAGCGLLMAEIYLRGFAGHEAFGFTALALATAGCLLAIGDLAPTRWAAWLLRPWAWLGAHSYELYLFHLVVLGGLLTVWPKSSIALSMKLPLLVLFWLLAIAVAAAAADWIGRPLNRRLRQRYLG